MWEKPEHWGACLSYNVPSLLPFISTIHSCYGLDSWAGIGVLVLLGSITGYESVRILPVINHRPSQYLSLSIVIPGAILLIGYLLPYTPTLLFGWIDTGIELWWIEYVLAITLPPAILIFYLLFALCFKFKPLQILTLIFLLIAALISWNLHWRFLPIIGQRPY
jgi:hypothetical protein